MSISAQSFGGRPINSELPQAYVENVSSDNAKGSLDTCRDMVAAPLPLNVFQGGMCAHGESLLRDATDCQLKFLWISFKQPFVRSDRLGSCLPFWASR